MSKPDFMTMTRPQLRQYILENRDDANALSIYLERFKSPDSKEFPAPQSLEDLENLRELHHEHLEQHRNQA